MPWGEQVPAVLRSKPSQGQGPTGHLGTAMEGQSKQGRKRLGEGVSSPYIQQHIPGIAQSLCHTWDKICEL